MGMRILIMETVQQVVQRYRTANGNRTNGHDSLAADYYHPAPRLSNGCSEIYGTATVFGFVPLYCFNDTMSKRANPSIKKSNKICFWLWQWHFVEYNSLRGRNLSRLMIGLFQEKGEGMQTRTKGSCSQGTTSLALLCITDIVILKYSPPFDSKAFQTF